MISGKFNEAHLFATNALTTADAHVFTSTGNCSSVLTKSGTWENKFKKMAASDEAKYSLIKMCENQMKRMAKSHPLGTVREAARPQNTKSRSGQTKN
jgi:hypothetical protein